MPKAARYDPAPIVRERASGKIVYWLNHLI
jgi:hypothetical protein